MRDENTCTDWATTGSTARLNRRYGLYASRQLSRLFVSPIYAEHSPTIAGVVALPGIRLTISSGLGHALGRGRYQS